MAEKKPGLLKRMFSFGFGKKKQAEEEVAQPQLDAPEASVDISAGTGAQETEARKAAAEDAARQQAEAVEAEAAAKRAEADKLAAEQAAKEEAARQQAADAAKKEAEEKALADKAKKEAEAGAKAQKEAAEKAARQQADAAAAIEETRRQEAAAAKKAAEQEAREKAADEAARKAAAKKAEDDKREAERLAAAEKAQRQAEQERLEAQEAAARQKAEEEEAARIHREQEAAEAEANLAGQPAMDDDGDDEAFETEKETVSDTTGSDIDLDGDISVPTEQIELEETRLTLTERKRKKPEPEPEPDPEEGRKSGWLKRLTKGLSRSSSQLRENIAGVFTGRKLDDEALQDLEDILIQADLGVETAMKITDALSDQKFGKEVTEQEVREVMAAEIEKILDPVAQDLDLDLEHQPHVILVVGVNGSGKTTTIGKLAAKLYDAGFSTTLVAGDTFRAAAIEQLKIWGERTHSPVMSRPLGSDAAGLAFDAWAETREQRRDVMLMDTAGRLQNKKELMAELEKIVRVLKKQDPEAPHTVLLTLDATTGQNALNQVEIFKDIAGVNGIVMTKLDGTARGGILVSISAKHQLPVFFAGVGEQVEDLEPFEARDFARSIAGLPPEDE